MLATNDDELWIYLRSFLNNVDGTYPVRALANLDTEQRRAIASWAELLATRWADDEWRSGLSKKALKLAQKYR